MKTPMFEYAASERANSSIQADLNLLAEMATDGWELCAVVVLPVTFSRLESNIVRYYFKREEVEK